MQEHQITTISFFKFTRLRDKIWAFFMMQFGHAHLQEVTGLSFYKLMGSGKDLGFNPLPDWSVYCLLQVWDTEQAANIFFEKAEIIRWYDAHTSERGTIYMRNIMAHGFWSGKQPFMKSSSIDSSNPFLAVITRATIKTSRLVAFWKYVPTSQKPIATAEGLLYTKGVGEMPIKQMSTFSIWRSTNDMKAFAYNSAEHQKAIAMTRELNWYSEELFSRFQPYKMEGTWQGKTWQFCDPEML